MKIMPKRKIKKAFPVKAYSRQAQIGLKAWIDPRLSSKNRAEAELQASDFGLSIWAKLQCFNVTLNSVTSLVGTHRSLNAKKYGVQAKNLYLDQIF